MYVYLYLYVWHTYVCMMMYVHLHVYVFLLYVYFTCLYTWYIHVHHDVYLYIYIYIYTHFWIYVSMYIYLYFNVYWHINVCIFDSYMIMIMYTGCRCTDVYSYVRACIPTIEGGMGVHTLMCFFFFVQIFLYIHMNSDMYIFRIRIHKWVYTRLCLYWNTSCRYIYTYDSIHGAGIYIYIYIYIMHCPRRNWTL